MGDKIKHFVRFGHIPLLIVLQIIFIICFAVFVDYDPITAKPHGSGTYKAGKDTKGEEFKTSNEEGADHYSGYPMFQDVHVMIFIGFGFLMTFLKKYGLSAMSLNMLIAVICLQWATLIYGFFHLHTHNELTGEEYAIPRIYLNQVESMLYSDFAAAAVLISFGVIIGTTSPLQLMVMALIEIVLFFINEVIGRKYLKAIDAGDTIFVHTFGAYFGLGVSRILYTKSTLDHKNEGSDYTHDHFSMIGTIFLWMFWPSFNSATAVVGDAQHRGILNTYFSLCACVLTAFALSAAMNKHKKFVMEHIQNATLAGGVAIGAVADLMVGPWAALTIGSVAGIISVLGYDLLSPFLKKRFKIHDTCGVHNLHGMPGVLGSLISCIVVSFASKDLYGDSLNDIFAYIGKDVEDSYGKMVKYTAHDQAVNQFLAFLVTMVFAIFGGLMTGFILKAIGHVQELDKPREGTTVMKMAASIQGSIASVAGFQQINPEEALFSDEIFFEVHQDEKIRRASVNELRRDKSLDRLSYQPSPKM